MLGRHHDGKSSLQQQHDRRKAYAVIKEAAAAPREVQHQRQLFGTVLSGEDIASLYLERFIEVGIPHLGTRP